ncbi:LuxR C-terminal-related transcriptional regulator [Streptomyces sp. NPDC047108]|uniref:LuxR C-terminal-related transcriptional regulator n=1 Tax=Streptomyces sp. NPDC047108 TaxID=3155025 RepID=UPI0033DBE5B5
MTTRSCPPEWPLVGRADELATATRLLTAPDARGIVVTGPPGAGKTRLAHECWKRAVQRGHPGVRTAATRASRSVPLGALAPLLTPRAHGRGTSLHFRQPRVRGARRLPTVLLIDDVDLLDDASVDLLRPLLASRELLLIGTASDEGTAAGPGSAVVEDLLPVPVRPLSVAAVGRLLEQVLRGPVERRTLRGLHTVGGGRPLYLRELVSGALAGGELVCETGLWRLTGDPAPPQRLVELVRYRLSAVPEQDSAVLEDLALCGPEDPELLPAESLARLRAEGLVRTQREGERRMAAVADPLHAEVLRTTVPVQRARRILLSRAERTEARSGIGDDARLRCTLWRVEAADAVPAERLAEAVELARADHDFPAALGLAEALVRARADAHSYLLLGEFRHACGRPQEAEQALARALELATTDDERLFGVVLRTQNLAQGLLRLGEAFDVNAAEVRGSTDTEIQAVLRANEAALWTLAGDVDRASARLESAMAHESDRPAIVAAVPSVYCLTESGRSDEALAVMAEHAERPPCTRANSIAHPSRLLTAGARALAESGRLDEAERMAHEAYDSAVDSRAGSAQIRAATDLGWICYLRGHMVQARCWFASVVSVSREHGYLSGLWAGLAGRALVDAVTGDLESSDESWAAARALRRDAWLRPEAQLVQAWRSAALGRVSQARSLLLGGARSAARTGLLVLRSHLLFDVARLGDPHAVHEQLAQLALLSTNPCVALRARTAGALAAGSGEELERLSGEWEEIGALLIAAETRTAAAGAQRGPGAHRRSARCREEAERLAALCDGARTPGLTPHTVRDSLTGREMEIALLAANGLGNAQIAEQLLLSVRTVGNHLQRVYSKIGIRDRRLLRDALRREPLVPGRA